MLRAPKVGNPFKMYIAAQEPVIGAVLLKEDGKEFSEAYVSRHLLDAENKVCFHGKTLLIFILCVLQV
jgi:hypothetical protein